MTKKYAIPTDLAAASVFMDRFTGLLVLLFAVILTLVLVGVQYGETRLLLAAGIVALLSIIAVWCIMGNILDRLYHNMSDGPIGKVIATLASWHAAVRAYRNHPGALTAAIALSFVFLFLSVLNYWFGALTFQSGVEIRMVILIVPSILFFGSLPVSIGGWGLLELSAAIVFQAAGFEPILGLSAALLLRSKSVILALIGGTLYLLPWRPQPQHTACGSEDGKV